MASISSKNLLQEYCQKHGRRMPEYLTMQLPDLQWTSYLRFNSRLFVGTATSKKEAEKLAANAACKYLTSPRVEDIGDPPSTLLAESKPLVESNPLAETIPVTWRDSNKIIILIDVENLQPILPVELPGYMNIICVKSTFSSVNTQIYESHPNCQVKLIHSAMPDAADHYMTYLASEQAVMNPECNFVIVSRDKSSAILVEILKSNRQQVEHFTHPDVLLKWIDGFRVM